jgi:hypothetical protein
MVKDVIITILALVYPLLCSLIVGTFLAGASEQAKFAARALAVITSGLLGAVSVESVTVVFYEVRDIACDAACGVSEAFSSILCKCRNTKSSKRRQ